MEIVLELLREMLNWDFLVNLEIPSIFFVLASLVGLLGYGIVYFLTKTKYGKGYKDKKLASEKLDLDLKESYDKVIGPLFFGVPLVVASFLLAFSITTAVFFLIVSEAIISDITLKIITIPISAIFYISLFFGLLINTYWIIHETRRNYYILHNAWVLLVHSFSFVIFILLISIVLLFSAIFVRSLLTEPGFANLRNIAAFSVVIIFLLLLTAIPIKMFRIAKFKKK